MPRSLVKLAAGPRHRNGNNASDEIGRARQDQSNGLFEAECFDDGGEEVFEAVGGEMHMCHESKDPDHGVLGCLLETLPRRRFALVSDRVKFHAACGEDALFGSKPFGVVREVGQNEVSHDGDDERDSTLKDKQPAPSTQPTSTIHSVEDTGGDEASKGGREDIARVQDGDAGGHFLAGVEYGEEVDCAGVVGCLRKTEEEAGEKEASEILGDGGQRTNNGPEHHRAAHVATYEHCQSRLNM